MGSKKKKVAKKKHLLYLREKARQMNERNRTRRSKNISTQEKCINANDVQTAEQGRMESPISYLNLDDQHNFSTSSTSQKTSLESECTKNTSTLSQNIQKSTNRKRKHDDNQMPYRMDGIVEENNITGHRIVDFNGFLTELKRISNHESLFNCGLNSLEIISETRIGLTSKFKLRCQMCKKTFSVKNSSDDLNKNAVSGVMVAGCGSAELNQFIASLDLPSISEHTFNKVQDEVCNEFELTAWEEMVKAGQREREAAVKEGKVNKDGIPMIDVVLDGCWSKRSYKTNYAASSGAAAIIGRRFGQVLFMSVKNKYCCICARAEKKKLTVQDHSCYKNYSGPSTAMESSIILEGFKKSIEMHGLIYNRFIADGDSSTYAKILEARPYNNTTVEKIQCKNHILRNFCNKLQQLKTDTKYTIAERKVITNEKILSARKYIINAVKLHNNDISSSSIQALHKDITQSLKHGFGEHGECNKAICTRETTTSNDLFFNGYIWQRMRFILANVASHSRSLIENVDSNIVESFNSVIAKFVGGKRVNYALRRSYQARCAGAVISFNTGKILSTVRQNIYNEPVGDQLNNYEQKKQTKRSRNRNCEKKKRRHTVIAKMDHNYGENADRPDLDPETFELEKATFLKNLNKTDKERQEIERRTILQSGSGEWMELRRNLLTASNFGKIIKRNVRYSCQNIVKNMLYKANLEHVSSIAHGRKNEQTALEQLSGLLKVDIAQCGLFIDELHPFLGATPDGIIADEDTLVEVKCPIAPYNIGIDAAIQQGKMHFWRINKGVVNVNKKSDWYIQAQGQMHIAKKSKCILAVWYGQNKIKTEIIERDEAFWKMTMEPKLISFYYDCLLPELVDPRFTRNRPIRDPPYVKARASNKENVGKK